MNASKFQENEIIDALYKMNGKWKISGFFSYEVGKTTMGGEPPVETTGIEIKDGMFIDDGKEIPITITYGIMNVEDILYKDNEKSLYYDPDEDKIHTLGYLSGDHITFYYSRQ